MMASAWTDENSKWDPDETRNESGSLTIIVTITSVKKTMCEKCTLPEALTDFPHSVLNTVVSNDSTEETC